MRAAEIKKICVTLATLAILAIIVSETYPSYSGNANVYLQGPQASSSTSPLYIRLRPLDTQYTGSGTAKWVMNDYNAQQVLQMISTLKPTVLERYTSGPINPTYSVPVCSTCQAMNTLQFLDASQAACSCPIWPRLTLPSSPLGLASFELQAQALLNLGVSPQFTVLSIDLWAQNYPAYSQVQIITMFQTLEAQGWKGFDVNDCGGYRSSYGYAKYADVCINTSSWQGPNGSIGGAHNEGATALLYIDFPGTICKFITNNTPQQQFQDWTALANNQNKYGYYLVYMVVQPLPKGTCAASTSGYYDANQISYGGETQYQLFESLVGAQTTTSTSSQTSTPSSTTTETSSNSTSITSTNTSTTSSESTTNVTSTSVTHSASISRSVSSSTVTSTSFASTSTRSHSRSSSNTATSTTRSGSSSTSVISPTSSHSQLSVQTARVKTAAAALGGGTGALVFLAGLFPLSYIFGRSRRSARSGHRSIHNARHERARIGGH